MVLKYVYMKGKVNKRLDNCIYVLLKLARDEGIERLVKIEKGKNTKRISMIRAWYQSSLKLSYAQVSETEQPSTWEVQSCDGKNKYFVSLVHITCPHNCSISCAECNICVHMFMCNCADASIRTTICKHIHLVARFSSENSNSNTDDLHEALELDNDDLCKTLEHHDDETSLLLKLQEKTQLSDIAVLRKEVQTQLSGLAGQLHLVQDTETLKDVRSYITSAMNLLKARKHLENSFPITKKEPANKLIAQKRCFFSTKRKRKQARLRIMKPTAKEKDDICTALLDNHISLHSPESKSSFASLSRNTLSKCTPVHTCVH